MYPLKDILKNTGHILSTVHVQEIADGPSFQLVIGT